MRKLKSTLAMVQKLCEIKCVFYIFLSVLMSGNENFLAPISFKLKNTLNSFHYFKIIQVKTRVDKYVVCLIKVHNTLSLIVVRP